MCVPAGGVGGGMRVTETIRYVSDCCQLNCDFESSRSALGCLPSFVSSSLPVAGAAKRKMQKPKTRKQEIEDFEIVYGF